VGYGTRREKYDKPVCVAVWVVRSSSVCACRLLVVVHLESLVVLSIGDLSWPLN